MSEPEDRHVEKFFEANAARCDIPPYMHGVLIRYLVHHIKPGDFLTAVLENDLREACERADSINRHMLFEYVSFLYNCAPSQAWGSKENVKAWLEAREINPGRTDDQRMGSQGSTVDNP